MIRISDTYGQLPFSSFKFSGGEIQVKVGSLSNLNRVDILATLTSSDDVMELLLVTDALCRRGVQHIHLICPYLPYARQDRVCAEGEALSLKVFCNLINSQNYDSVEVWDVHSEVALALLDRSHSIHQATFVSRISVGSQTILVSPDAGALKKIYKVAERTGCPVMRAEKVRNPLNGEITETTVHAFPTYGKDVMIVDDICDGGRTFIELAKKLKLVTGGRIYLYVTHGIFSQGLDVFKGMIDKIYCPNVFPNVSDHELLERI